jgi:diacylglycerol kinase (ATP)
MAELRPPWQPSGSAVQCGARSHPTGLVEDQQTVEFSYWHGKVQYNKDITACQGSIMTSKDTCVIFNPRAGRNRAGQRMEKLRRHLETRSEFWPTRGPGDGEGLACQAIAAGFTTIGAAGGDGTVHEVANGIMRAARPDICLAVYPVGSANDYAHSLGLDPEWWARSDGSIGPRVVDVGRVRTSAGRERWFINGLGLGFNCAVTLEARRLRWLQGVPLYVLALLRALQSRYATPRMQVTTDARQHAGPILALTVGLGCREGNFKLTPYAEVDDGWFDYLHVGPLPRWKLVSYVPRMVTGRLPFRDPLVHTGRCRALTVQSEAPLAVHTDGEFFCQPEDNVTSIVVELLPGALRVQGKVPPGSSREKGTWQQTTELR